MTVTEAPRGVLDAAAVETETAAPTGLAALVGTGDPRTIGKLFVGTSLLFLLVSGVTGVMTGFELVDASKYEIVGSDYLFNVVTLHGISGTFLVALPLLLGLATAVVPLQVGASTVAFPRATAAAYWVWLVSSGLVLTSFAINGGPFDASPDRETVALLVAGLIGVLSALCVATISVVTTVIAMRAPGMSLRRTPLFSWSMLVAGSVWLLTLPILGGVLLLAYVDVSYGAVLIDSTNLYEHFRWVLWQPTVYIFAVPALGIIADIVPVFAQTRHKRHRAAMFLIGLFGALSFGAWAQSAFGAGAARPWQEEAPWIGVSFLALVPLLGLLGLWSATLAAGRPKISSPLILAQLAGFLLLIAVAAGAASTIDALDLFDTTWTGAQAYLVLLAAIVAAAAGLVYWSPKLYGSLIPEALPRMAAPLLLLGALVMAVPYGIAGALDQPDWAAVGGLDLTGKSDLDTIETLNLIGSIGQVVIMLGGGLLLMAVLRGWRRGASGSGESVGDDPWSGHTLEWATSSPPPVGNFAGTPEITSEAPLYDARHAAAREASAG